MEKYFNDEFDDCKSKHRYMKRQRIREEGGCEDTLVSTSSKLGQLSRDDVNPQLQPFPLFPPHSHSKVGVEWLRYTDK